MCVVCAVCRVCAWCVWCAVCVRGVCHVCVWCVVCAVCACVWCVVCVCVHGVWCVVCLVCGVPCGACVAGRGGAEDRAGALLLGLLPLPARPCPQALVKRSPWMKELGVPLGTRPLWLAHLSCSHRVAIS